MEKATAVQLIRDNLGFNNALAEEIILRHMDLVKGNYEGEDGAKPLPGFLFRPTWEQATEVTTNIVLLPDDFIELDTDWPPILRHESIPEPLEQMSWEQIKDNGQPAMPQKFVFDGFRLYLFPIPNKAYPIQIPHFAHSPSFTTEGENPWLSYFANLIIWEAVLSIGSAIRDSGAIKLASEKLPSLQMAYYTRVESMKHTNREYYFGPVE